MSASDSSGRRLDSWKAIAEYLCRDVATVRRWERQGLPVRRVPGGERRAVFAYTSELDEWLRAGRQALAAPDPAAPAETAATPATAIIATPAIDEPRRRHWLLSVAVSAVAIVVLFWLSRSTSASPALTVTATPDAVVASAGGAERWRFAFSPELRTAFPSLMPEPWRLVRGPAPALYVAVANQARRADDVSLGGTLIDLDLQGQQRRAFSFMDRVTLGGRSYEPPWGLTWCDVLDRPAGRRIAVAAHHLVWSPSLVTVLDEKFERQGTFTHNGWIEFVEWLGPDRLVIGGYSDDQDGGLIGLLDTRALDGPPIRLVVMPRTAVNLDAGARFNRAVIQRAPDRLLARTIEVPEDPQHAAADIVYEFTPDLELVSARPSTRFVELQQHLKQGPALAFAVKVWEPATGWVNRLAGK